MLEFFLSQVSELGDAKLSIGFQGVQIVNVVQIGLEDFVAAKFSGDIRVGLVELCLELLEQATVFLFGSGCESNAYAKQ